LVELGDRRALVLSREVGVLERDAVKREKDSEGLKGLMEDLNGKVIELSRNKIESEEEDEGMREKFAKNLKRFEALERASGSLELELASKVQEIGRMRSEG
jgi:hypothetical protein